jgi:hypothetical protein
MKTQAYLSIAVIIISAFLSSSCKKSISPETKNATNEEVILSKKLLVNSTAATTFVSNPKNLNIVMFIPTDNPALPDYKTRLSELFIHFQNWYHTEMLRYGYNKYLGLPLNASTGLVKIIEINAQHPQADYPYSSSITNPKVSAEIATYKAAHPSEFSASSHTLILLPERTDGGDQPFYGLGKTCYALDNSNMAVNKIPNPSSNYIGGMLHELGHGLNLPHDHAKYATEEPTLGTSLMGSGNVTFSKGQPTFLTGVDAAILNRNEVFQSPLPAETPYQSATTTINTKLSYNALNKRFDITVAPVSTRPISDILVYLDPVLTATDGDYNAVTWRFNTGSTINVNTPFSELFYKTNEDYVLKVKLLLTNGTTVSKNYSFNFLNGIPQFGATKAAIFYQHGSYGGYNVSLPIGQYTTADLIGLGISNNDISSLTLGSDVKVILYDGDNFTGTSYELTASSTFLSTFNDKASSIKIVALNYF